jgi:hypothetical protein
MVDAANAIVSDAVDANSFGSVNLSAPTAMTQLQIASIDQQGLIS